ncbi:MAG TPA: Gfo/Idh/MocA family oxidoreductase [Phycisphaerae bacterium]|nr:Gfo/Idh/MocA family oxidoreductase [Phycisphaerae bacterium]HOJ74926.1 Gfo/Idh/MocA family oxidoreductase [Phycisphaerae bacterium]HOM51487.1 Gfo/Idh/MocA family oxidoreductase [Phycisphaerae bacterium]HON68010.1 Gfo/Idh/MocA family oxidoreductase [Phycisphaerae bacterium]HOQ88201.1 Gfo/Idh/MocA family oxidoreductase [Phycisphaerae bacterium]
MAETIRAGMIGLDTSHCNAFAKIFKEHPDWGVKVVAAYPSFSPDVESSANRIEEYKKVMVETHGVKLTESIDQMLEMVDVVLIESVDGRRHLPELKAVAPSGKPTFIDKPFAASLADAKEMVKLIKRHKLPCFSASSLRFDSAFQNVLAEKEEKFGKILGVDAFSPAHLEKTNPGLFWYGIHGVEILYTLMGPGCQSVSSTVTPQSEVNIGVWPGGRLGTLRGIRAGKNHYGATIISEKAPPTTVTMKADFYPKLCEAMVKMFRTGEVPVPIDETLEMCAFIDAAMKSARENADDIKLDLE